MRETKLNSEQGSALIMVIGVIMGLATFGVILATLLSSSNTLQILDAEERRAFYAAESGLEFGIKEYLGQDEIEEFEISDYGAGDGLLTDISMTINEGGDIITITSVGKSSKFSKTIQTVISGADQSYIPDYAVFSEDTVKDVVTVDSLTAVHDPNLIFGDAPVMPRFDLDELRDLASADQGDGNSYYYSGSLTVAKNFSPPDGAIVFVDGDLKFTKGDWSGTVHFVTTGDIIFHPSWKNTASQKMTLYLADPTKELSINGTGKKDDDDDGDSDHDEGDDDDDSDHDEGDHDGDDEGEDSEDSYLSFIGGVITTGKLNGAMKDKDKGKNFIIKIIHSEDAMKNFMTFSVNGSSRIIMSSEWKSIN